MPSKRTNGFYITLVAVTMLALSCTASTSSDGDAARSNTPNQGNHSESTSTSAMVVTETPDTDEPVSHQSLTVLSSLSASSDYNVYSTISELLSESPLIVVGTPGEPVFKGTNDSLGYFVSYTQTIDVTTVIRGEYTGDLKVFSASPDFDHPSIGGTNNLGTVVLPPEALGILPQVEGVLFLLPAQASTNQKFGADGWWLAGVYQGFVPLKDGRLLQDVEPRADAIPGLSLTTVVQEDRRLVEGIDGLTVAELQQLVN